MSKIKGLKRTGAHLNRHKKEVSLSNIKMKEALFVMCMMITVIRLFTIFFFFFGGGGGVVKQAYKLCNTKFHL